MFNLTLFIVLVVALLFGTFVGYLIAAHRTKNALYQERTTAALATAEKDSAVGQFLSLQQEGTSLEEELTKTTAQLQAAEHDNVRLKATLQAEEEKQKSAEEQARQLEEDRRQLKQEFENLANKIFEDKGKTFSEQSKTSLDSLLKPFGNQMSDFRKRVDEIHTQATKTNSAIEVEIKKIMEVGAQLSDDTNNLTTALKGDKKTTGNWGEMQLERALQLSGLKPDVDYKIQDHHKDLSAAKRYPDVVVYLPEDKHLVIDSKVSLVDYDAAIAAETDAERKQAIDNHTKAVQRHIDSLYKKDYSNLVDINSPNFVLMFMPIEPAYIEAMKHKRELFYYGYDRNVIMVSHTTLMPILQTVANLWKNERGNAEVRKLLAEAGGIYDQACLISDRLKKLGESLGATVGHYNRTVTGLFGQKGLVGKVERFRQLSTKNMPDVQELHPDIETRRLEAIPAPATEDDTQEIEKLP